MIRLNESFDPFGEWDASRNGGTNGSGDPSLPAVLLLAVAYTLAQMRVRRWAEPLLSDCGILGDFRASMLADPSRMSHCCCGRIPGTQHFHYELVGGIDWAEYLAVTDERSGQSVSVPLHVSPVRTYFDQFWLRRFLVGIPYRVPGCAARDDDSIARRLGELEDAGFLEQICVENDEHWAFQLRASVLWLATCPLNSDEAAGRQEQD